MGLSMPFGDVGSPLYSDLRRTVVEGVAHEGVLGRLQAKAVFPKSAGRFRAGTRLRRVDRFAASRLAIEVFPGDFLDALRILFPGDDRFVPDFLQESVDGVA